MMKKRFSISAPGRRPQSRSGIALVVTLIFVTVIAFMAITFLVLSQRERGSVSSTANQTDSQLAAKTALDRATARLVAPMLAFTNAADYHLLVSTNYISRAGFDPSVPAGTRQYTNVNYDFQVNGSPLTGPEQLVNLTNLLYDPRPPVYVATNTAKGSSTALDFRYYLDLNRNGRYDPSGMVPLLDVNGKFVDKVTGAEINPVVPWPLNVVMIPEIGDPEWIGVLAQPGQPHSAENEFVARYAYVALPISKTLDLNYIFNQARTQQYDRFGANFLRNQGVGSWEINLAAFLCDLNTNAWGGYTYDPLVSGAVNGNSFASAVGLYGYRINYNAGFLSSVRALYGTPGDTAFRNDLFDDYSSGPLPADPFGYVGADPDTVRTTRPWAGADNPTHYFTMQELFDPNKTAALATAQPFYFSDALLRMGTNNNSYDRYTYYRLLSQLGTDSAPQPEKMNLNYDNLTPSNGVASVTNFMPWQPLVFFTNAAQRLLAEYYPGQTNLADQTGIHIQLYPTNFYTPSVHRLMQVAANLYDATTNDIYPSVFRPVFMVKPGTRFFPRFVYLVGYEHVTNDWKQRFDYPCVEAPTLTNAAINTRLDQVSVYNAPWVVGAKEGLPNFNQLFLQSAMTVTRKLEFRRQNLADTNSPVRYVNQMYTFSVSNLFGVDLWNSNNHAYTNGDLALYVTNETQVIITNYTPGFVNQSTIQAGYTNNAFTNYANTTWRDWPGIQVAASLQARSFRIPLSTNVVVLPVTNMVFLQSRSGFDTVTLDTLRVHVGDNMPVPQWAYVLQNRLRVMLVDTRAQRIVDCVNLSETKDPVDVTSLLGRNAQSTTAALAPGQSLNNADGWNTNVFTGNPLNLGAPISTIQSVPTVGIMNQILLSSGELKTGGTWRDDPLVIQATGGSIPAAQEFFRNNLFDAKIPGVSKTNIFYAPYYPVSTMYSYMEWKANDPLVHYMVADLTTPGLTNASVATTTLPPQKSLLGQVDAKRYRPWGSGDANSYNPAYQDPLVYRSDDWRFPTNKLANVGLIGRVHRGTPWQTIYLKSTNVDNTGWIKWTGNIYGDMLVSQPTNDWRLFDVFTAVPNDNAARGQLAVNQDGLAAWSAVLSGVVTLTNNISNDEIGVGDHPAYAAMVIDPARVSPQVQIMVDGINRERARMITVTNVNGTKLIFPAHAQQTFSSLGEVLATPELTLNSPFLYQAEQQRQWGISDAAYERIPQQIMGLLRLDDVPRFVVYAYGQSLKPALNSKISTAGFSGVVTNYQITGEAALRAVVRIEGAPQHPHAVIESYNYLPPD